MFTVNLVHRVHPVWFFVSAVNNGHILLQIVTMTLTIHLLRHGQTALSREDVFCGSGLDPELTSEGFEMAQAFAATYRAKPWRAIFSSSLRRGIDTAKPLCDELGIATQVRADLNEISYGKWEGSSKAAVDKEYHDDYLSWLADPAWHAPTGGESAIAVARRALGVIDEITQEFHEGNVLMVSHKATIRIILCSLLGIDVGRFRYRLGCPVGSVSVVEFSSSGPLLHTLADRGHLNDALRSLPGT
ncbi:MAG TPA: histidine phosphatase family protein [Pyrinomonadaceae bacterium]|nr:histidine phosphatase family protein [Pyrinomonadaceae bacterium]